MGKVLKTVLPIAGLIAGAILLPGITIGGLAIFSAGAGAAIGGLAGSLLSSAVKVKSSASAAQISALNLSFDPNTPRKLSLGTGLVSTDVLYYEPSGSNQEYVDYIICLAAHEIAGVDSIYSDDKLMWSAGTVQSGYTGYLTVDVRLVGTSSNGIAINGGSIWNANCTLTGCAYIHLRIKRTGATSKVDSPFAGGLPSRMTIVGRGAKLYDPRQDSTVGGSGSMRATDQTTWGFTGIGDNHALQALTHLIGWRTGSVVSVGVGMPPARLDMGDWITAANICDEAVTKAAGGTHRRYEGAGIFSDADAPTAVQSSFCTHMNAELRDVSGKLGIRIAHNDLSGLTAFDENDVLGAYTWDSAQGLNDGFNAIRGQYSDPTIASLYQLAPYSSTKVTSVDGIDRPSTLDLALCHDPERAQRISTQVLLRGQYQARFSAAFGPRMWSKRMGDPISFSFGPCGLLNQAFRIESMESRVVLNDDDAQTFCQCTLVADDPAVYVWTSGLAVIPASAVPSVAYNPRNNPLAISQGSDIGVENGATFGDNLISNPNITNNAAGWSVGSGIILGGGTSADPGNFFRFVAGGNGTAIANNNAKRPLNGVEKLFFTLSTFNHGATGGSIFAYFTWWRGDGTASTINPSTGINIGGATSGAWERQSFIVAPPADASLFIFYFGSTVTGADFDTSTPRLAKTQAAADVTATVLVSKGIQDGATRTAPAGAWTAPHAYLSGDIVTYSGTSWVATAPHTSTGAAPPGVSIYWQLLAAAGTDGSDGSDGTNGLDGAPGPIGPAAPAFTNVGTGTSTGPTVFLAAGAAISFDITVSASAGGSGGGSCVTQAQSSITGTGSWSVFASVSSSNVATEPIFNEINPATFTNSTGVARSFDFRVVSTGFTGRTVVPDQSYIRGV